MTAQPTEKLDEEMKAWEQVGIESLVGMYERLHDHGMYQDTAGNWKYYPSGHTGEVCQTCGKVIEPIE